MVDKSNLKNSGVDLICKTKFNKLIKAIYLKCKT